MTHDPMCNFIAETGEDCDCDLIAKIRSLASRNILIDSQVEHFRQGQRDGIARSIAALTTIPNDPDALIWFERFRDDPRDPEKVTYMVDLDDCISVLRALQNEP